MDADLSGRVLSCGSREGRFVCTRCEAHRDDHYDGKTRTRWANAEGERQERGFYDPEASHDR